MLTKNKVIAGKFGAGGAGGTGGAARGLNGSKGQEGSESFAEGGGVALTFVNVQITDAIVQFNRATSLGGGVSVFNVTGEVINSVIDDNWAAEDANLSGSITPTLVSVLPSIPIPIPDIVLRRNVQNLV